MSLVSHLRILQRRYGNLDFETKDQHFDQKFKNLLSYYHQIYECFMKFQDTHFVYFFVQVIFIAITVCFNGFLVVTVMKYQRNFIIWLIFLLDNSSLMSTLWKFNVEYFYFQFCFNVSYLNSSVHKLKKGQFKCIVYESNWFWKKKIFQSSHLCECIYNGNWRKMKMDMKSNVCFTMLRFQKPFVLRTVFFTINLKNFTNVRNSYQHIFL